jgi:hypothetical protein
LDLVTYRMHVGPIPDELGPEDLSQFAYDVLHGRWKCPKRSGKAPWADTWRNTRIVVAVVHALRHDPTLNPTRNDAGEPESACDIVSECPKQIGIKLSYKRVAELWGKSNHAQRRQDSRRRRAI